MGDSARGDGDEVVLLDFLATLVPLVPRKGCSFLSVTCPRIFPNEDSYMSSSGHDFSSNATTHRGLVEFSSVVSLDTRRPFERIRSRVIYVNPERRHVVLGRILSNESSFDIAFLESCRSRGMALRGNDSPRQSFQR